MFNNTKQRRIYTEKEEEGGGRRKHAVRVIEQSEGGNKNGEKGLQEETEIRRNISNVSTTAELL